MKSKDPERARAADLLLVRMGQEERRADTQLVRVTRAKETKEHTQQQDEHVEKNVKRTAHSRQVSTTSRMCTPSTRPERKSPRSPGKG